MLKKFGSTSVNELQSNEEMPMKEVNGAQKASLKELIKMMHAKMREEEDEITDASPAAVEIEAAEEKPEMEVSSAPEEGDEDMLEHVRKTMRPEKKPSGVMISIVKESRYGKPKFRKK